ncbi:MAG: hypothetical protein R3C11_10340 [Planctomycetaceae bacterium]
MKFDSGAYAVVTQTLSAFEHHQTVKITGTKASTLAAWSGAKDRTREPTFALRAFDGEKVETIPITKITGELFELEDQIDMMVHAVRDGQPPVARAKMAVGQSRCAWRPRNRSTPSRKSI